jgi:polyisoprenoid-binding protein YceI
MNSLRSRHLALLVFSAVALRAAPVTYTLDPVHSSVTFVAQTLFTPIRGSFMIGDGKLVFDPENLSANSIVAEVPIGSVGTLNSIRDKNITTKEGWFAAAKFPSAKFVSKSWKASGKDRYLITGDFTLNGITREVTLDATHFGSGPGLEPGTFATGWEASVTLDRTLFGITADAAVISPKIPVIVSIQGLRK